MEEGDVDPHEEEKDATANSSNGQRKKGSITIPSFQDVALRKDLAPTGGPSFIQAFSFVKGSEFYSPPPEPPPAPRPHSSDTPDRYTPSPSTTAPPSSSPAVTNRNAILVSHRQKGNPLLKHIRNVKWEFADVVCDYLLGQSSCALYLSLRYHLLHPDYIYYRIRELQKNFKLRVVLCHIDVEDVVKPLQEVTRTALLHECTLLCGWSLEECGRYLETIKMYENKSADSIREHMDADYLSRLTHALTTVRRINKTDVVTLGSTFGSLSCIMDASMEELARCPGIGERKVKRLYDAFHEPFRRVSARPTILTESTSVERKTREAHSSDDENAGKEESESSKKVKKHEVTVRSALTAAFAKYADKVCKHDGKDGPSKKDGNASLNEGGGMAVPPNDAE